MTQIETALEGATAVERTGDGQFRIRLDSDWSTLGMLNGGYLNVPVARAAVESSPHPYAVAVTTDYLASPAPGEAEIQVETLKVGRTVGFHRVLLTQDGRTRLSASVVTGELPDQPADAIVRTAPPVLVRPEDCERVPAALPGGFTFGMMQHIDVRMTPQARAAIEEPDNSLATSGWVRAADGAVTDPYLALLAVDAFAPVSRTTGHLGWAPTVQLCTYLRALPADGWLRGYVHGELLAGGWFDEQCAIYDEKDQLVAQSRQLARVPR